MRTHKKNDTYIYYNQSVVGLYFSLRVSGFSRFFSGSGKKNKY